MPAIAARNTGERRELRERRFAITRYEQVKTIEKTLVQDAVAKL
jgi:hypothetical protein